MPLFHRGIYRCAAFAILLVSASLGHEARAAEGASAFIVQLGAETTATMTNRAISSADRVQRFGVIVGRDFDVPEIAQFVLGRYWETATADERQDFTNVFQAYMIRVYSDNFADFSSDTFRVIDQRALGDATVVVRTSITSAATGQPMILEWLVSKKADSFKVYDLNVDGVSLVAAQQEEFASVMQRTGGQVATITRLMRSKLDQMETAGK
jgi:phospholipid transport system substrate-binding protein